MTVKELEKTLNQALKQLQELTERVIVLEKRVTVGVPATDEDLKLLKKANKDHYCGSQ